MNHTRSNQGKIIKNHNTAIAVILAVVILSSWLSYLGWTASRFTTFSSPDEAANNLLSANLAKTGTYRVSTSLTPTQLAVFRPRSLSTSGSTLGPGSFLGFVQYQSVARWALGDSGPVILTILAFGLALICLYRIGRRYWSPLWCWLAVGLAATMPPLAIFNTLVFHQAALYTSLLIMAGWVLLRFQEHQSWSRAIVIGLIYGAALAVRPIEVLFTGPLVAIIMIVHRRGWLYLLATTGMTLMMQIPWLIASWQSFGAPLASGYATGGIAGGDVVASSGALAWYKIFLPPGGVFSWHFAAAIWDSFIRLLPLNTALVALALIYYLRRKLVSWQKFLKLGAVMLFVLYYFAYYGSLNLAPITVDNVGFQISYLRYWLPVVAAMAAGIVVALRSVWCAPVKLKIAVGVLLIGINVAAVIGADSGLRALKSSLSRQETIKERILRDTDPLGLIIANNYDKLLVGDRLTSFHAPQSDAEWALLKTIAAERPVYFITTPASMSPTELVRAAKKAGFLAAKRISISDATLWRLIITNRS